MVRQLAKLMRSATSKPGVPGGLGFSREEGWTAMAAPAETSTAAWAPASPGALLARTRKTGASSDDRFQRASG